MTFPALVLCLLIELNSTDFSCSLLADDHYMLCQFYLTGVMDAEL